MALLVRTQQGHWKVIYDETKAVDLLDAGVDVYVLDELPNGSPSLRKVRVKEDSRVTETRTVSADIEDVPGS
jgi:hypothetical protein